MPDFAFKQGDNRPPLIANLTNGDGTRFDLTGYTVVLFVNRTPGVTTPIINGAGAVVNAPASNGQVQYNWSTQDRTNFAAAGSAGEYKFWWRATDGSGNTIDFPSDGYHILVVEPAP